MQICRKQITPPRSAFNRLRVIGYAGNETGGIHLPDCIKCCRKAWQFGLMLPFCGVEKAVFAIRQSSFGLTRQLAQLAIYGVPHLINGHIGNRCYRKKPFQNFLRQPGKCQEFISGELEQVPVKHLFIEASNHQMTDFGTVIAFAAGKTGNFFGPGDPILLAKRFL